MNKIFWQKKCDKFRDTMKKILSELKRIYGEEYLDDYFKEKEKFHKHLAQKGLVDGYGNVNENLRKLAAFHIQGGSTPNYALSPFFDFSGELSIAKYWESRLENLKQIPTN